MLQIMKYCHGFIHLIPFFQNFRKLLKEENLPAWTFSIVPCCQQSGHISSAWARVFSTTVTMIILTWRQQAGTLKSEFSYLRLWAEDDEQVMLTQHTSEECVFKYADLRNWIALVFFYLACFSPIFCWLFVPQERSPANYSNFSRAVFYSIIYSGFCSSPKDKILISEIVMVNAWMSLIDQKIICQSCSHTWQMSSKMWRLKHCGLFRELSFRNSSEQVEKRSCRVFLHFSWLMKWIQYNVNGL